MDLSFQNCQFWLHFIIIDSVLSTSLFLVCFHNLNYLSQIGSLRNVSQRTVAMLSYIHILSLKSHSSQSIPVSLSLVVQLWSVKYERSFFQIFCLECEAKVNQRLIESVGWYGITAAIWNKHFSLTILAFDSLNVSLNVVNGDFFRIVNGVPNIEILSILCHYHLALRHPLSESTIRKKCAFCKCS